MVGVLHGYPVSRNRTAAAGQTPYDLWAASTVAGALSGAEPGESRPSDLIDRRIAVTVAPAPARRAGLACGFGFVQLGLPEGVSFEQEPGWLEPGVEQHAWESEYEAILPLIEDDPAEALPELASLVERMLVDRGYRPRGLARSEQAVSFAAGA